MLSAPCMPHFCVAVQEAARGRRFEIVDNEAVFFAAEYNLDFYFRPSQQSVHPTTAAIVLSS